MCLKTREYIMGLENLQQFFQFVLKPHQVKNPVVAHISLAVAFCDRAFEESSDTLHCNTE